MKILLINPPYSRLRGTKECTEMVTPLGLSYVGAYLKKRGHGVALYDANYSSGERLSRFNNLGRLLKKFDRYSETLGSADHPVWDEVRRRVAAARPDVVGVTVLSPVRGAAFRVAAVCREVNPDIRVVFGGYHPTSCPDDVLRDGGADAAIRGEGELTFAELVERYGEGGSPRDVPGVSWRESGNVVHNPDRPLIEDLDSLPFPVEFLVGAATGKAPVQYARGCPYGCKFCADRVMWRRKVRYRSAGSLVSEMEEVVSRTGIREFTFVDGTFNLSRRKVAEFCELVLARRLRVRWDALVRAEGLDDELLRLCRRAGCSQMNIGVESGSQRVLDDLGKSVDLALVAENVRKISSSRIATVSFFCVGMPPEAPEDLRATRDLILRLPHDFVILSLFTPLPGTEFFDELKAKGMISGDHDYDMFGYKSPNNYFVVNTPESEYGGLRDEILRAADKVNKRGKLALKLLFYNLGFYMRYPGQLWRRVVRYIGF